MKSIHKNLSLFIILGILAHGILVIAMCSSHCAVGSPDIDSPKDAGCSISSHFFVPIALSQLILLVLPIFAFFTVIDNLRIPAGFFHSLYRPPKLLF
ncbi:MAG: hypothetical protein OET81_00020 [Desulfobacteraceae bacterium]|nr:hypothetical protein [Desulfobacteraceae bacterium]